MGIHPSEGQDPTSSSVHVLSQHLSWQCASVPSTPSGIRTHAHHTREGGHPALRKIAHKAAISSSMSTTVGVSKWSIYTTGTYHTEGDPLWSARPRSRVQATRCSCRGHSSLGKRRLRLRINILRLSSPCYRHLPLTVGGWVGISPWGSCGTIT